MLNLKKLIYRFTPINFFIYKKIEFIISYYYLYKLIYKTTIRNGYGQNAITNEGL
jgi:hypothetical protein